MIWGRWAFPEREQLPYPVKVYCIWCSAETYNNNFICGKCTRTEEQWFRL